MKARWTATWLAALVLWIHAPLAGAPGLLGAAGSDVVRAAWGFDHVSRALPGLPFWTDRVGFPVGVKLIVLPQLSAALGAPLNLLLGPVHGFNAWILVLLWAAGMATALLAEQITRSAAAGLLAGTVIIVQPMTLLAISDGTAEHVALWGLPAMLAMLAFGRRERAWGAAIAAGLLAGAMALDSPYNAIFALPFLPLVLAGTRTPNLVVFGVTAGLAGLVVGGAYWGLPVSVEDAKRGSNAVSLPVWWQWEAGTNVRPWDYSLGAGFIPVATLVGALALAALRPMRALPWVLVALLCGVFALGPSPENARALETWLGPTGGSIGRMIVDFNEAFPVPVVRFPRRWLIPGAIALSVAAGIGLSRVRWEAARAVIAAVAAVGVVWQSLSLTSYRRALPNVNPPTLAFASFVADHPTDGAFLALPRVRGANHAAVTRADVPVFAGLGETMISGDMLWIQTLCGRASVFKPDGLRTMIQRWKVDDELDKLLHDLDDLTNPVTTGNPIPPSATQEPERRARAAMKLVEAGLGFVILDEAAYGADGLALARAPFARALREERRFDDGSGVTVFVVAP